MAKETLSIPEEHLPEVVAIIRCGMKNMKVSREVKAALKDWCSEIESYLADLDDEQD